MASPPWATVEPHEQCFTLITGANSGVGLGISQRLIDQFLLTRPPTHHLILLVTTRSPSKSRATIHSLREHLGTTASSPKLRARFTSTSTTDPSSHDAYDPSYSIARVHILSLELDLCNLISVSDAAATLTIGTISNPPGMPATKYPFASYENVRIPRLDAVIFNAGVGGWTGLNWAGMVKMLFRDGLVETTTFPDYKLSEVGRTIEPLGAKAGKDAGENGGCGEVLGEVFTANVFGHYIFARGILPLLTRTHSANGSQPSSDEETAVDDDRIPTARIIWTSSIEAMDYHLSPSDIQGLRSEGPYESSKRLTDILALSSHLPSVRAKSASYFSTSPSSSAEGSSNKRQTRGAAAKAAAATAEGGLVKVPPKMYVTHPGIVVTTIFPLHWFLMFWYKLAMYMSRWLGSPWHPVTGYLAAYASVWLVLEAEGVLDATGAERSKWGSCCSRGGGRVAAKRSEVSGWGWEGKVVSTVDMAEEKDGQEEGMGRLLSKKVGRWSGSRDTTDEGLREFEVLGRQCWEEMERLRGVWEGMVKGGK